MRSFAEKAAKDEHLLKVEYNKCCGNHAAALVEPITKASAALHKALWYFTKNSQISFIIFFSFFC
jgi:hypothetical protein